MLTHWHTLESFLVCRHDPIAVRTATVVDALNDTVPVDEHRFLSYIVSTQWEKMQVRATRWSSRNFIWQLSRITKEGLMGTWNASQEASECEPSPKKSKRCRGKHLSFEPFALLQPHLADILTEYGITDFQGSLFARLQATAFPSPSNHAKTAWEFHLLPLGMLLLYAETMQQLHEFSMPSASGSEILAARLVMVSRALRVIMHAEWLDTHLKTFGKLLKLAWWCGTDPECGSFCKFARCGDLDCDHEEADNGMFTQKLIRERDMSKRLKIWLNEQVLLNDSVAMLVEERKKLRTERNPRRELL